MLVALEWSQISTNLESGGLSWIYLAHWVVASTTAFPRSLSLCRRCRRCHQCDRVSWPRNTHGKVWCGKCVPQCPCPHILARQEVARQLFNCLVHLRFYCGPARVDSQTQLSREVSLTLPGWLSHTGSPKLTCLPEQLGFLHSAFWGQGYPPSPR